MASNLRLSSGGDDAGGVVRLSSRRAVPAVDGPAVSLDGEPAIVSSLRCSVGRLVDLSVTGARVEMRRVWGPASGHRLHVTLGDESLTTTLEAEVVWSTPTGRFRREVGLRFVGASAASVEVVRTLMGRVGIVGRGELRRSA